MTLPTLELTAREEHIPLVALYLSAPETADVLEEIASGKGLSDFTRSATLLPIIIDALLEADVITKDPESPNGYKANYILLSIERGIVLNRRLAEATAKLASSIAGMIENDDELNKNVMSRNVKMITNAEIASELISEINQAIMRADEKSKAITEDTTLLRMVILGKMFTLQ
ncbi:MAG: hypothetical protein M3Q07_19840 [Pseudobdellovibrionaceae bacterium]|nr:hypothetical protein [Pseudobdellovibrionaceae bacterium]